MTQEKIKTHLHDIDIIQKEMEKQQKQMTSLYDLVQSDGLLAFLDVLKKDFEDELKENNNVK